MKRWSVALLVLAEVAAMTLWFVSSMTLVAALGNAALLISSPGGTVSILLRMLTGFCLAGVYPVGMKIMVGWGKSNRGWLVGLLVGGLTLASAAPHLLSWAGGSRWQLTTLLASALAALAALLVLVREAGSVSRTTSGHEPPTGEDCLD